MDPDLEQLKQHLPMLEYLQRHNWTPRRRSARQEFVGLCPLHEETRPSFYVNACKNLFYCHGCGHGGDLIRFVELFLHVSFRQSVAHLQQELASRARSAAAAELLAQTAAYYQLQLHRASEAGSISGTSWTAGFRHHRRTRHWLRSRRETAGSSHGPGLSVRSAAPYWPDRQPGPRRFLPACNPPVPAAWPDREPVRPQHRSAFSASFPAAI
jgi:hypothetical protein